MHYLCIIVIFDCYSTILWQRKWRHKVSHIIIIIIILLQLHLMRKKQQGWHASCALSSISVVTTQLYCEEDDNVRFLTSLFFFLLFFITMPFSAKRKITMTMASSLLCLLCFFSFKVCLPGMTTTNNNDECKNVHHHLFFHLLPSRSGYALSGPLFGICCTVGGCICFVLCHS